MAKHRIIDKNLLMQKLSEKAYQYVDELQMKHLFDLYGENLQIEEELEVE